MNRLFILLVLFVASSIVYSQPEPIKILPISVEVNGNNFVLPILNIIFTNDEDEVYVVVNTVTQVWNFKTGEKIREFSGGWEAVNFNSNFTRYVFGSGFGKSFIVDPQNGEVEHVFEGHSETIGSGRNIHPTLILWLEISNHDKYLVTAANDQKAILWDLESKEMLHRFASADLDIFDNTGEIIPTGFKVGPVVFSPDNTLIAFNHSFWNMETYQKEFEFDDDSSSIGFIDFSGSGKYFMSNAKGSINVWDWETKELIYQNDVDGDSEGIYNLDISPDERYLIGGSSDENVYIIDLETEKVITIDTNLSDSSFFYHPVQFHPSGDYFAVGGGDGKVLIYDFQEVIASQSGVADWEGYE